MHCNFRSNQLHLISDCAASFMRDPILSFILSSSLQEMLAIMKSIYDMMGRYTYPCVRDEAPYEHVDKFFQVLNAHKYKQAHKYTVQRGALTNAAFLSSPENG